MSQTEAITCRDVHKAFVLEDGGSIWKLLFSDRPNVAQFHALRGVTLSARKGAFTGLLGENGAGKSTLLRTLGGVYAPDSGVVTVNGDWSGLYELGITGNDHLTGLEFAQRYFDVFAQRREDRASLIADSADFCELGEALYRPIRTYSAGMKARLFFALATARQASVYIVDEVLSVGDEFFQNKCWRRLRHRLGAGAAGIIATHDWSAILRLCAQCAIISHGRIIREGESPEIVRAYLGLDRADLADGGKFAADLTPHAHAKTLAPWAFTIPFEAQIAGEWRIGAAIERFIVGYGWEHILHLEAQMVATTAGRHQVQLYCPELPLAAGDYELSLFLSRQGTDGGVTVTDARSWTYGDSVSLRVEGPEGGRGVLRLRLALNNLLTAPE
jgi:lipopolysaccharide transport system ATP-binding protein